MSIYKECKFYTHYHDRPSDEQIFLNAFQTVLHTGTNYEILLQLEHTFQSEIEDLFASDKVQYYITLRELEGAPTEGDE